MNTCIRSFPPDYILFKTLLERFHPQTHLNPQRKKSDAACHRKTGGPGMLATKLEDSMVDVSTTRRSRLSLYSGASSGPLGPTSAARGEALGAAFPRTWSERARFSGREGGRPGSPNEETEGFQGGDERRIPWVTGAFVFYMCDPGPHPYLDTPQRLVFGP